MREESVFKRAAVMGAEELLKYFSTPKELRDSKDLESAAAGLKAGSNFAKLYAAETNRLTAQVVAAKYIGLSGEALVPVFEELSGVSAQQFLPNKPERSGGKRKRAK